MVWFGVQFLAQGVLAMADERSRETDAVPPPIGTLFILTVYLALLAGMWGAMLWGLIGR